MSSHAAAGQHCYYGSWCSCLPPWLLFLMSLRRGVSFGMSEHFPAVLWASGYEDRWRVWRCRCPSRCILDILESRIWLTSDCSFREQQGETSGRQSPEMGSRARFQSSQRSTTFWSHWLAGLHLRNGHCMGATAQGSWCKWLENPNLRYEVRVTLCKCHRILYTHCKFIVFQLSYSIPSSQACYQLRLASLHVPWPCFV